MAGTWKLRGYVVESLLGRGASSEVWRARVASSGDPVALKRLLLSSAEQSKRAHAEAAMLTVLDHPNLVRLHDLVPLDGAAVLVLDLADGGSLADLLATRGRLTPGEVITAVAPVAAALAYVHRSGVVHGDVTPANILFTPGGVALLADLGVARLTGDDRDAESTPAYIDPAVAQGSVPVAQSDVFMLGAVALHALTGSALWPAGDTAAVLSAAREGAISDIAVRLADAGVSDSMASVVVRALQVDPSKRGTAADLALDLRHSGTPIAVELSAGRARADPALWPQGLWPSEESGYGQTTPRQTFATPRLALAAAARAGPNRTGSARSMSRPVHTARHAARPGTGQQPAAAVPDLTPPLLISSGSALPGGERPGAAPPTVAVRRPRPSVPIRRLRTRPRPRFAVAACAAVVASALLVSLMLWAPWNRSGARSPDARRGSVQPGPAEPEVTDWIVALRRVDALRADAFATRDASLLRRVYVSGPLLRADTSTLLRLVPPGCTLLGAVTHFDEVEVTHRGSGAEIKVRAQMPPATLHCPDRPTEQTSGVARTRLRFVIVQTHDGPRISQERAVAD